MIDRIQEKAASYFSEIQGIRHTIHAHTGIVF